MVSYSHEYQDVVDWRFWIVAAGSSIIFGMILVNAVFNVYFHPLRSYPGPLIAKITPAYGVYHAFRGDMHVLLQDLHERYGQSPFPYFPDAQVRIGFMGAAGDIVRYGPNKLVFNSRTALEDIYGFGKSIRKSKSYGPMVPWEDGWTVNTCRDKELHRRMRRTLVKEMSNDTLRQCEPSTIALLDRLVCNITKESGVDASWSEPQDMTAWSKSLSIDAMAQLSFGQSIGIVDDPGKDSIIAYISLYAWRMGVLFQWPSLSRLGVERLFSFASRCIPSARRFNSWREKYTDEMLDANGHAKRGIFSHVVHGSGTGDKGYRYSNAQMAAEGAFLILVGSDSNSAAISGALFYLSRNPRVREKLEAEIRQAFPTASAISGLPPSPLPHLPYLNAVIAEVLRLCPPTPGVPWREVEDEGAWIDGHFIPPGVDVGVCVWPLQRRSDIYRDPSRFWPERWLPGTLDADELKLAQSCNKPFSIGPRACGGRKVAMMQVQLAIAKLLWHCEMKVPEGSLREVGEGNPKSPLLGRCRRDDFQIDTHFGAVTKGPWLQFRLRETCGHGVETK